MGAEIFAAVVAGVLAIVGSVVVFALESRRKKKEQEESGTYTRGNDSSAGLWRNIVSIYESAKRWVNSKISAIPDRAKRDEYSALPKSDYAEIARQMLAGGHMERADAEKLISLVGKFKSLRKGSARIADLEELKHLSRELNLPN